MRAIIPRSKLAKLEKQFGVGDVGWPRAGVAGLTNGVGGIWLWMAGQEREERIQNVE